MSEPEEYVISIEEPCATETMKKILDTRPSDVAGTKNTVTKAIVGNKIEGCFRQLEGLAQEVNIRTSITTTKIQKVPFILGERGDFKKYFEPRVVSFGPVHHGKKNLQLDEGYKRKLAAVFIKDSGEETRVVFEGINAKIKDLKECYEEELIEDYEDEALSLMLFLDGCSILQLIYTQFEGDLMDFNIKYDHIAFAQNDLFLLENQIPFQVLEILMNFTKYEIRTKMKNAIKNLIVLSITAPEENKEALFSLDLDKHNPIHLLDLLQQAIVFHEPPGDDDKRKKRNEPSQTPQYSFRNVQELKAAGISVKPGKTCSLKDISFTSFCFTGCLRLPPIIVDDSTGPKLLNLIAYEACPDNLKTRYEITSYVCFLDSLIDHANDVKELRLKKILHNHLGCDDEVASLFNKIATDLVPNPFTYEDVKRRIQQHYDNRCATWVADVTYTHFSSPWTILAFVAALLALGLTGIQTWFGVFPRDQSK